MLLVVGLRLLKFLGIVRRAGHLKDDGADAVDGAQIAGVDIEHVLEFGNGLVPKLHVRFGRSAGDVLAGVSGGQVEAGVHQRRIEISGLFEKLDGVVVLPVLKGADAFIEEIASLQFVAARSSGNEKNKSRASEDSH